MFVTVRDRKIHAVSFGTGPRTFLVYGTWVGNFELWLPTLERLGPQWRVVAVDLPGTGESEDYDSTLESLAEDIVGVMDQLGIDRCVMATESAGAKLGVLLAARNPERLEGLCLVAPGVYTLPAQQIAAYQERLTTDYTRWASGFIAACFPEPESEHLKRWGRRILHRSEPEAAARLLEVFFREPVDALLGQVKVPALVVQGSADAITPEAHGREVAAQIPGCRFALLEGAGHAPLMSRPAEVAQLINAVFGSPS